MMMGKVMLVGAGPGDAGLITVRGLKALRSADVIVYDHLGCESLLNESRKEARWIYAGKEAGNHYLRQEETNDLLIRLAREGQTVVRLKGGDPFIFGRGGEEGLALKAAGVPFEVIPGVSSCYSVPALAGIPITYRKLSSAFHVITAHEDQSKDSSVIDYDLLAKEKGTLIFLMGLGRLGLIADRLMAGGKAPETPAAVITSGTTGHQRQITGPLCEIADRARQAGLTPPGILVVGPVAGLSEQLMPENRGRLAGRRILVTAHEGTGARLAERIREEGGEPVCLSLIDIRPREDFRAAQLMDRLQGPAWFVFTSRNGVDLFFDSLIREGIDYRLLAGVRFAVIGKGTAGALKDRGFCPDLVPEKACSQSLAEALCDRILAEGNADGGPMVYLLRAREASAIPAARLRESGIRFTECPLYETISLTERAFQLRRALAGVDAVTFCSSSAVTAFVRLLGEERIPMPACCYIGSVSAEAGRSLGLPVDQVAESYDLDGLVAALGEMES